MIRDHYRAFPAPIHRINLLSNKSVNCRIWPVNRCFHQTMFHRIKMNITAMVVEILVISDHMFPESSLPNHPFTAFFLGLRWLDNWIHTLHLKALITNIFRYTPSKSGFNHAPTF